MSTVRIPMGVLAILYLAGVGAAAQIAKIIPVLGYLSGPVGLSLSESTLVMSAVGFAGAAVGMVAGKMVVDLGLWRVMCVACITAVLSGLLLPWATSLPALLGLRAIEGLGHIAIVAAAPTLMMSMVPSDRAPVVMGVWASFFGVAFAASQAFALTGLALESPATFLRWHVALFLPAIVISAAHWNDNQNTNLRLQDFSLLPKGITRQQVLAALIFLFHAGIFTSVLAFAQTRIGGDMGVALAPILPLLSLATVFAATPLLVRFPSLQIFTGGSLFVAACLVAAWIVNPAVGYIGVFLGIGLMQAGVFARIGEVCRTDAEGSVTNGAFTQLGNTGNIVIPYVVSAALAGWLTIDVELVLLGILLIALSLVMFNAKGLRHGV